MKCPTCKEVTLVMSSRQEIEIDYCPECRGVWLDRGELDKIIEKSNSTIPVHTSPPPQYNQEPKDKYRDDDYYKYKRKKSFLSEIFD